MQTGIMTIEFLHRIDFGAVSQKAIVIADDDILTNAAMPQRCPIGVLNKPRRCKVNVLSTVTIVAAMQHVRDAVCVQRRKEDVIVKLLHHTIHGRAVGTHAKM